MHNISDNLEQDSNENLFQEMGGLLKEQKETPFRNFEPFFAGHYAEEFKGDLFKPYFKLLMQIIFQLIEGIHHNKSNPITWSDQLLKQWNRLLSTLSLNKPVARNLSRKLLLKINGAEEFNRIIDFALFENELKEFETEKLQQVTIDKVTLFLVYIFDNFCRSL